MIFELLKDVCDVHWLVQASFLVPESLFFYAQWIIIALVFGCLFSDKCWANNVLRRLIYFFLSMLVFCAVLEVQYFFEESLWDIEGQSFSHYFYCEMILLFIYLSFFLVARYRLQVRDWLLKLPFPSSLPNVTLFCFGAYFFCLNFYTYYSGNFRDRDFVSITQTIWKLSEGIIPYSTIFHRHFLNNHWSIIYYPIAAIYKLVSHPLTLVALALISGLSGLYLLYCMARHKLGDRWLSYGFLCSLLGLAQLHESLFTTINQDVHAFFFMAASFYVLLTQKRDRYFWFWYILACLCKEDVSFLYIFVGLWVFVSSSRKRFGMLIMLVSFIIFVSIVSIVLPMFNSGLQTRVLTEYAYMGSSIRQIMTNFLWNPLDFLSIIITTQDVLTLVLTMSVLLLFLCFGGWTIMMFVPAVLLKFMNINGWVSHFSNQHLWFPLLFLAIGALFGLHRCRDLFIGRGFFSRKEFERYGCILLIGFGCAQSLVYSEYIPFSPFNFMPSQAHNTLHKGQLTQSLISKIPKKASLLADSWILSLTPEREHLYEINSYYWDNRSIDQSLNWEKNSVMSLLNKVDYCLLDTEMTDRSSPFRAKELFFNTLRNDPKWTLIATASTLRLFKKKGYERTLSN